MSCPYGFLKKSLDIKFGLFYLRKIYFNYPCRGVQLDALVGSGGVKLHPYAK
jgi:hypothetical protein